MRSQLVISETAQELWTMSGTRALIPAERIERRILLLRDQKVMLDVDLARLFGLKPESLFRLSAGTSTGSRMISCFSSPKRSSGL